MSTGEGTAIRAVDLTKHYRSGDGNLVVFAGLNLEVPEGEKLALVGESGSGKSTLLHLLGGLDRPTEGAIYFGQNDICQLPANELAEFRNRATHRAGELSGGEQQRVVLARALVGDPRVLLADEPTGSLDFRTGEMIMGLLDDLHRSRRLTSIHVTHNLNFARRADRVVALERGQLVESASDRAEGSHHV